MRILFILLISITLSFSLSASELKQEAIEKISVLETLILQAQGQGLDATREECAVWFAIEFLKFADWDDRNKSANESFYSAYSHYRNNKTSMANNLPDYERSEVIKMLDTAIEELTKVISGDIVRRAVPKIDWENIITEDDMFTNSGKPVFLYDYFSKSPGNSTTDASLYNDYLGNVDHAGNINPNFVNADRSIQSWRLEKITKHAERTIGYTMLWHTGYPGWIADAEPELKDGRSHFVGADIDNPTMREVWELALESVAAPSQGKKYNQFGYILVNEPHWFSEAGHWTASSGEMQKISSYTLAKFRTWLSNKYDNILALNTTWETSFTDFDNVTIVIPISTSLRGKPIWYDWCRFNMDRATEWITFLHDGIVKHDADAMTHTKIMPNLFVNEYRSHGIDLEALTELTEMIGNDGAITKRAVGGAKEEWEDYYSYYWEEIAVSYDFMESVSPNKIHVNSESHFLSTNGYRDWDMQKEYVRSCYWLATLHGMDANLTWWWTRDPDGSPESRVEDLSMAGAYAGTCAQQPRVANEYTKTMMDLNAFSEEIMELRTLEKSIRIFHSETSAINKTDHMGGMFHLYEELYFNGVPLGYATEKIINKQDNSNWEMILVYNTEYVTDEEFNALQSYLDNGGTVLIDTGRSLIKNEYGQNRSESLSKGTGTIISIGSTDTASEMKDKAIDILQSKGKGAVVGLNEKNGLDKPGCMWRVTSTGPDEYLMTIVNLGKNTAELTPFVANSNKEAYCTNMLTGVDMGTQFELEPEGVLLLKLKEGNQNISVDKNFDDKNTAIITTGNNSITVQKAEGKRIRIISVSGATLVNTTLKSNRETFVTPTGLMLVAVEGDKTVKRIVM